MAEVQITCVVKPNPDSPIHRIQELRGRVVATNELYRGNPAQTAAHIMECHAFFVLLNNARTYMERVQGRNGAPDFVRTRPNGDRDDNLLRLRCKNP
jgi:hypothetical protein